MTREDSRTTLVHLEVPVAAIDSTPAGILFLAIGATSLLSTLFLVVFFAGVPVFGPLNDAFIGISALLSAVVAWQLVLSRTDSVGLTGWLAPVVATAGALMLLDLIGIIPIVQGSDDWNLVPHYVLYTAGVGAVGWIGLYPVWCILVALRLLRT